MVRVVLCLSAIWILSISWAHSLIDLCRYWGSVRTMSDTVRVLTYFNWCYVEGQVSGIVSMCH
jgi:hypothetical protein